MVKQGGVFDLTFLDSKDEDLTFYTIMAMTCCLLSSIAAGLTMAYLSLDQTKLKMLEKNGSAKEKEMVRVVMPLLADHHRLLVTLLFSNTLSNEALPIFLDALVPSWLALVLSVTAVTIFCEILPQSLSTSGKHKLFLAYQASGLMRWLMFFYYPIAAPAARLLDVFIHADKSRSLDQLLQFTREELLSMVDILKESENERILEEEGEFRYSSRDYAGGLGQGSLEPLSGRHHTLTTFSVMIRFNAESVALPLPLVLSDSELANAEPEQLLRCLGDCEFLIVRSARKGRADGISFLPARRYLQWYLAGGSGGSPSGGTPPGTQAQSELLQMLQPVPCIPSTTVLSDAFYLLQGSSKKAELLVVASDTGDDSGEKDLCGYLTLASLLHGVARLQQQKSDKIPSPIHTNNPLLPRDRSSTGGGISVTPPRIPSDTNLSSALELPPVHSL